MDKIKFSPFDLFAYLSSGLAALIAIGIAFTRQFDPLPRFEDAQAVLLLLVAYMLGHVVAIMSNLLIEEGLLGAILLKPSTQLFLTDKLKSEVGLPPGRTSAERFAALSDDQRGRPECQPWVGYVDVSLPARWLRWTGETLRRWNLLEYGEPLDDEIRRRVLRRFVREGRAPVGKERYWAVYAANHAPRGDKPPASSRVERYQQLYSFARNLAIVAFLFPILSGISEYCGYQHSTPLGAQPFTQRAVSIGLAFALTLRFLKFYHLNALEMFIVYSQGDPDDLSPSPQRPAARRLFGLIPRRGKRSRACDGGPRATG